MRKPWLCLNSLNIHYREYSASDSYFVGYFALGEGWHNYHVSLAINWHSFIVLINLIFRETALLPVSKTYISFHLNRVAEFFARNSQKRLPLKIITIVPFDSWKRTIFGQVSELMTSLGTESLAPVFATKQFSVLSWKDFFIQKLLWENFAWSSLNSEWFGIVIDGVEERFD